VTWVIADHYFAGEGLFVELVAGGLVLAITYTLLAAIFTLRRGWLVELRSALR
jgi:hypothetical protein